MKPYIFDTETTGTDHKQDQIIEAAWLELPDDPNAFLNSEPFNAENYCERFRPSVPISLGAQAVHHILTSDLKDCRPSSDFELPENTGYLIGHNVDFDWRMAGEPSIKRICTLALSRFLFPDKDSHTQSAMIYMMARRNSREEEARQRLKNAHAAMDDVRNCASLFAFLLVFAEQQGHSISTWDDVHQLSELARIPTIMGFGKHTGLPINQVDSGYVRWYRGQAETDPYYLAAFKLAGF